MRRFIAVVPFWGCMLLSHPARAQQITVTRGAGADECPDERGLAAVVDDVRKTQTDGTPLHAQVHFTVEASGRYTARIVVSGAREGVRTLTAGQEGRCAVLARAVAVSLALLLDADASTETAQPSPPAPRPEPATAPHDEKVRRPILLSGTTAAVLMTVGLEWALPAGPGAVAGPELSFSPASALLVRSAFFFGPQRALPFGPGEIDVGLVFGDIEACWMHRSRYRLHGALCGAFAMGRLHGQGHSYPTNRTVSRPYRGLGWGVHLGGPGFSPVVWDLSVRSFRSLQHETFRIDGLGTGYDPPAWGVLAGMALGVRMW